MTTAAGGDAPAKHNVWFITEHPEQAGCFKGGSDGTRTRDLRRDRPAF
jgi:hypothetical protein